MYRACHGALSLATKTEFDVSGCIFSASVASKRGVKASELAHWKQRLLGLRAEILAEGDVAIEPVRKDETRVGSEEDEQPLVEMSQVIASKRNLARTAALARVSGPWRASRANPRCSGCAASAKSPSASGFWLYPTRSFVSSASKPATASASPTAAGTYLISNEGDLHEQDRRGQESPCIHLAR